MLQSLEYRGFAMRLSYALSLLLVIVGAAFASDAAAQARTALFAGGNFHELQPPFDALPGVSATRLGYTGGGIETIEVSYDPAQVSYETLLTTFWRNIDPFAGDGEFCNRGGQFKAVIYAADDAEREAAQASLARHQHRFSQTVTVAIEGPAAFAPAAPWHQQYYLKNPSKYRFYRLACQRDARLREIWGGDAPQ